MSSYGLGMLGRRQAFLPDLLGMPMAAAVSKVEHPPSGEALPAAPNVPITPKRGQWPKLNGYCTVGSVDKILAEE